MSRARFVLGAGAVISLAGCGSDGTGTDTNPPGRVLPPNGVSIVLGAQTKGTAAFTPNPLTISLANRGVVRWFNDDEGGGVYGGGGTSHNITADDGAFASGNFPPGATFDATYGAAGDFGYHCSIHPTMKGTVTVTP
jgi:plastocyanin